MAVSTEGLQPFAEQNVAKFSSKQSGAWSLSIRGYLYKMCRSRWRLLRRDNTVAFGIALARNSVFHRPQLVKILYELS